MPRMSVHDLGLPNDSHRPDLHAKGFETRGSATAEQLTREQSLFRVAASCSNPRLAQAAGKLAERLARARQRGRVLISLASPEYMRRARVRVIGHLWMLIEASRLSVSTVDLVPKGWIFSSSELDEADPVKLLNALRSDLNRCGAADATGFLFLGLHGEYESEADVYQLHAHGVATGEIIEVVDKLRKRRKFQSERRADGAIHSRVVISRKPITNLAYRLTYILKSYWPSRPIVMIDGRPRRVRGVRRIPEPRHSHYLLWLDRWSLSDMILLMGLFVGKDGLRPTGDFEVNR